MLTQQEIAVEAANRSPEIEEAWMEISKKRDESAKRRAARIAAQEPLLKQAREQFDRAMQRARAFGPGRREAETAVIEARYARRVDEITGVAEARDRWEREYVKREGHPSSPEFARHYDPAPLGGLGSPVAAIRDHLRSIASEATESVKENIPTATATAFDLDFRSFIAAAVRSALRGGPTIEQKSFRAFLVERKAGLPAGQVEAIVSVSGNVDLGEDVVIPGAFQRFVGDVKSGRAKMPRLCWSHQLEQTNVIGKVISIDELAPGSAMLPADLQAKGLGGLWIRAEFNRKTDLGRNAYELVRNGDVTDWSFMYLTTLSDTDKNGRRQLKEIYPVIECSPVGYGMNQEARTSALPDAEVA